MPFLLQMKLPRLQNASFCNLALQVGTAMQAFSGMADSFADFVWSASKTNLLLESGLRTLSEEARMKYLFKMFAKYAVENHAEELTQYRSGTCLVVSNS